VIALYLYMVFFAFAYLSLSAGTGALILFGAVQLTMFTVALRAGEHFSAVSWAGLVIAIAGLVYLVSPGLTAPDPLGTALMTVAGISWGAYSLVGRSTADPIEATAHNFLFAVPLVVATSLAFAGDFQVTAGGAGYAVASGAVASATGYGNRGRDRAAVGARDRGHRRRDPAIGGCDAAAGRRLCRDARRRGAGSHAAKPGALDI
jgi:drug/metabolite transporter (DMT)-like permease